MNNIVFIVICSCLPLTLVDDINNFDESSFTHQFWPSQNCLDVTIIIRGVSHQLYYDTILNPFVWMTIWHLSVSQNLSLYDFNSIHKSAIDVMQYYMLIQYNDGVR